jgi:hypothetical protein
MNYRATTLGEGKRKFPCQLLGYIVQRHVVPIHIPISRPEHDLCSTEPLCRFKASDTVLVIVHLLAQVGYSGFHDLHILLKLSNVILHGWQ